METANIIKEELQSNRKSTALRIVRVELFKLDIPLKKPFIISLGPIFYSNNIVVKLHTNQDITGIGECSPYPYIVGETQESESAIGKKIAELLVHKNPLELTQRLAEIDAAMAFNHTIKSAFDMALYDLQAKYCQLPLYAFLGGSKKPLLSDMTIGIDTPGKMATEALVYKKAGFSILKAKLGTDHRTDIARIKAIRLAIGNDIRLRIDANQAWDVPTAKRILHELIPYNIEHCEEPVARWDNDGLKAVTSASSIPIMADESLFDHHDAFRLASNRACDLFNIKLSKSGGINKALKILAVGEAAGVKSQVGSMGESAYGITALAHLALASSSIIFFDLDAPLMQAINPVTEGLIYGKGGEVSITDRPGIGADFDEQYLEKISF